MPQVVAVGNTAPPNDAEGCSAPQSTSKHSLITPGDNNSDHKEEKRQSPALSRHPVGKCDSAFKYPEPMQCSLPMSLQPLPLCLLCVSHVNGRN